MKQFIQDFRTGELKMEEAPSPVLKEGFVLLQNVFSLISTGTERATVDIGKASLIGKAKKRPDLVKQILANIRNEGVVATLEKVKTKLNMPKSLGYSCCGRVIESADFEGRFKPGDRVACAGQDYASHAEVVAVPQNLTVKIPDNVSFEEASFTAVGAIALQGIRQAEPKIDEKFCVVGLGLIGQITSQILKANGCSVFGVDTSEFVIEMAQKMNIDSVVNRKDENLHKLADNFTNGFGFDKVIVTASTSDNDPIILSTEILRKKGLIVVVGNVKMDIPRELFYKKELELKIATSCGPGRYDPLYEEAGVDYPYAYVRFTENRNMQAFLGLLSKGDVNIKPLITHMFDFEKALEAYNLILGKAVKDFIGVLLRYKTEEKKPVHNVSLADKTAKSINIGFIGAGSFAQSHLLPHLKNVNVSLDTVVTVRGINAKNVAEKFQFNSASTDPNDIIRNEKINTVFIATRHNTHAGYTSQALRNKKNVFVEKPLALNIEELKEVVSAYSGESILMVGFNRRFSLLSLLIKREVDRIGMPIIMNFRVNAGYIPNESWIQNSSIGGGRIIGEICHFIDLMSYFSGSNPKKAYASSIDIEDNKWRSDDNITANIEFENHSVGNLTYTAMGDKAMEKERLEIFAGGNSYVINDFKEACIFTNNRKKRVKNKSKGHKEEVDIFIKTLRKGGENPINFGSLLYTTLTTFRIIESLKSGKPKEIDISGLYS